MAVEQQNDTAHLPKKILFGRYENGEEVWLYQDDHIPGLYMAKEPLKLRPVPDWLMSVLNEPLPSQGFFRTLKSMLGLDTP